MVHRGKSSDQKDLIFGVQRSHPLDMKPRLDVFIASNINEGINNFQLVGSYTDRSCKVYKGDTIIAEVPGFSIYYYYADFNIDLSTFLIVRLRP